MFSSSTDVLCMDERINHGVHGLVYFDEYYLVVLVCVPHSLCSEAEIPYF